MDFLAHGGDLVKATLPSCVKLVHRGHTDTSDQTRLGAIKHSGGFARTLRDILHGSLAAENDLVVRRQPFIHLPEATWPLQIDAVIMVLHR
jgi:hypothetical protein